MHVLGNDSRREMEIRSYPALVYVLVPLVALVLQAWLSRVLVRWIWFDFPLMITAYFAMSRRSPIQGMSIGMVMGLLEDALTGLPIGVNGIAKTIVGFLAASVGLKIDVENAAIRVMLTFVLSVAASLVNIYLYRGLLGMPLEWTWYNELFRAIGNALIVIFLFHLLDRFQIRD